MKSFKKIIFIVLCFVFSVNVFAQTNFIRIENNNFQNGILNFRPYSVNYVVGIFQNCETSNYYVGPSPQYSIKWGYPHTNWLNTIYTCDFGRNNYSSTDEQGIALQKLNDDLTYLKDNGFNVVRIADINPKVDLLTNQVIIPTGSYSSYFSLVDNLLSIINENGLKAIINLGIISNIKELKYYSEFLEKFSSHFKDNTTIMAYSLLSEPFYGFTKNDCNDKILIGNWVNEMYYTIKRKDPNHLITIGLQHPETVINWDYGMMMVDFMSLHLYAWSEDPNYSSRMIWKYYKFLSNNYNFPWVISETGFSGTDITSNQDNHTGSEEDQLDFANDNIQRSQDCGCKGYGWWGHQDIGYGSNWEENLGFITRWPEQREKKARGAFANMQNIIPNTGNCVTPEKYLNIDEGTVWKLTGYVKDENGSPIKDALIFGTNGNVRVLADEQGKFKLYTNGSDYGGLWISAIGYELQVPKTITNNQTYTLKKINKNQWTKRFTNNNSNTLLDWTFNDYDRFLPCDFDGDGKDELLCIQFNNPERNKVNIYSFDNGKWINTWDNDGNNSFGGWSVKSFDKYLVGDFDGDGKDELQCLQLTPGYHNWSTTLRFINNEWSCPYSNSGTSSSFAGWWLNINDDFVVGDFNGDQKDEILCYQKNDDVDCFATMLYFENSDWKFGPSNNGNDWIGEWRLSSTDIIKAGNFDEDKADELICTQIGGLNDWITIQNFDNNTWNRLWSNEARNTEPIYFYRSNLVIGNFDFDDKDEILGINKSSAAKFDFVNPSLNSEWNIRNSTLSDWTINPKANCFFMHTIEKAPDYFFVIEKNKNQNYSGEMFSLNNLIQGNTSSLRSENVSINNRISDKDSSKADLGYVNKFNVKVFPNPTKGEVNIQAENGTINLIEVYNYQGQVLYEKSYNSETSIFIDISNFPNAIYLLKITNSESGITCNQLILNTTSK